MKRFTLILSLLFTLFACQKVVDINLNSTPKKYVIEGAITDSAGPYTIHITQTKDFQEDNSYPGINGAFVIIKELETNIVDTLTNTAQGMYYTKKITGTQGNTYSLWVVINTDTFTASSQMPYKVNLDTLTGLTLPFFGDIIRTIVPVYLDPQGIRNYYHFEQYRNGKMNQTIYAGNDDFTDGQVNSRPLIMNDPDTSFKSGDVAIVEMQCTDAAIYKYWYSMGQATGSSNMPANPVTNITGGALGYFSAHTKQRKSMVIP